MNVKSLEHFHQNFNKTEVYDKCRPVPRVAGKSVTNFLSLILPHPYPRHLLVIYENRKGPELSLGSV